MLFPLYLYEFNRDLSHTILMTLFASITCLPICQNVIKKNYNALHPAWVLHQFGDIEQV